ncbi:MAG TPA: PepSY-associated TM helix domain-containing protein, partial [Gemmatimonadales bacterium]
IHNVTGVVALVFLLALTTTGLVIGFESVTTPAFYKMTGTAPTPRPKLRVTPVAGATPLGPDSALALARAALPGTTPFQLNVPGPAEPYVIRARYPEDRTPGGRSLVVLNPYSGAVMFAEGSRGAPAGTRLVTANRAIHTGDMFGIPGKILVSLASLAALAQVVTGLTMWLKRRRPE